MTVRVVRGWEGGMCGALVQVSAPLQPRVLQILDALVIVINVIKNFHLIAGSVVTTV